MAKHHLISLRRQPEEHLSGPLFRSNIHPPFVCLDTVHHSGNMRSNQSKPTILDTIIGNFKKGFGGDYGVKLTPGKLQTLCEVEWLLFGISWPPEETLEVLTIWQVWKAVTGKAGHPDQFLYIDSWLEVTQTLPIGCNSLKTGRDKLGSSWPKFRIRRQHLRKKILQGDPEDEPLPPQYQEPTSPASPALSVPPALDTPPPSVSPELASPAPPEPVLPDPLSPEPAGQLRPCWPTALQMPQETKESAPQPREG
jgi:hypothetical protein